MSHSIFLSQLFQQLAIEKVTYCILKNYDKLPEESTRDVDIWVKKEDHKKFCEIMLKIANSLDWELITYSFRMNYYNAGEYYFIKENGDISVCVIDASPYLHWRGISYLDVEVLAKYISLHEKGFNIPSSGIEAAALIFRGAMMGEIKEQHRSKIIKCLERDHESFLKVLGKPFGRKISLYILETVKAREWDKLERKFPFLHRIIFIRSLLYQPFFQFKQWVIYYSGRLKVHFSPVHGFFLVLMGPDGSGKTTTAKALLEADVIKRIFIRRLYLARRFSIPWLKRIVLFFKKKSKKQISNSTKDNVVLPQPFGFLKSIFYVFYFGFEFFLGHYYLRRQKANCAILIFDRYFYDYFVFREFIKCPKWLLFLIAKVIPRPDAIIYLKNHPEVIYSRKPEFPVEEIKRQSEICEEIVKHFPNVFVIETSCGPEEVVEKIQRIIISKLRKKQKGSYYRDRK